MRSARQWSQNNLMKVPASKVSVSLSLAEDGSPHFTQVYTGETWAEAEKKANAQIQKTFLERVDIALIDIYCVTDQGIEWHDDREDPVYMMIYRQIQTLFRKHLVPDRYLLSQPEEGKFTLQVKVAFR